MHRAVIAAFVSAVTAGPLFATPCQQAHDAFVQARTRARLSEGASRRIAAKVDHAWRIYGSAGPQSGPTVAADMDAAAVTLERDQTRMPEDLRDDVRRAIRALSKCMAANPLGATAPSSPVASTGRSAQLRIIEAPDAVVPQNFRDFTLLMVDDDDSVVRLHTLDRLTVKAEKGDVDVARYFVNRGDGAITLKDEHAFAAVILPLPDPITIRLRGRDAGGIEVRGSVDFAVGRLTPNVQLVLPPDVTLGNEEVYVFLTHEATGMSYWGLAGMDGTTRLSQIPRGRYLAGCDLARGSRRYSGRTTCTVETDNQICRLPLTEVAQPATRRTSVTTMPDGTVVIDTGHGKATMTPAPPPPGPYYRRDADGKWYREDEDRRQNVFGLWFNLTPDGNFRLTSAWKTIYPEPLRSATEEELIAKRVADDKYGAGQYQRVVSVRARNREGQVLYRTNAWVAFAYVIEGRLMRNDSPSLMFDVPASAATIELTGWDAASSATFDVQTLMSHAHP